MRRTSKACFTSPASGRPSPCPAFFSDVRKLLRSSSIISLGNGCSFILPVAIVRSMCFRSTPLLSLISFSKSRSALRTICCSSIAVSSEGSLRRSMGHLPGEHRPAPSMKGLGTPFRRGSMVCPYPHQPAPFLGLLALPSSDSSSEVGVPSMIWSFGVKSMISNSSLMGRSTPSSFTRFDSVRIFSSEMMPLTEPAWGL